VRLLNFEQVLVSQGFKHKGSALPDCLQESTWFTAPEVIIKIVEEGPQDAFVT
jgi:hypothetical protein